MSEYDELWGTQGEWKTVSFSEVGYGDLVMPINKDDKPFIFRIWKAEPYVSNTGNEMMSFDTEEAYREVAPGDGHRRKGEIVDAASTCLLWVPRSLTPDEVDEAESKLMELV
jgi:hypothetical protein